MAAFITIAAIIIVAVIIALVHTLSHAKNIAENGIEVDGIVIKNETINRAGEVPRHKITVRYQSLDGSVHEGVLDVNANIPVGRKVQIKYAEGKYGEVAFVSQGV